MASSLGENIFTGFGNGFIQPGGLLFIYAAGTTTKIDTYTTAALTTPNTNPIVMDADGQAVWFISDNVSYKMVFAPFNDTDPPANPYWTIDNIRGQSSLDNVSVPIVAGEAITAGQWVCTSATAGDGRWYLTDADSGVLSITAKQIGIANQSLSVGQSGTAQIEGRYVLTSGSVTVGSQYYLSQTAGAITATAPTFARLVAEADSATSLLLSFRQPTAFFSGVMPGGVTSTPVGNVGAGEDDLMSYSGSASNFGTGTYEYTCFGTTGANVNTKNIKAYVGGVNFLATGAVAFNNQNWKLVITVVVRSFLAGGATVVVEFYPNAVGGATALQVTENTAATVTTNFIVKVTGESVSVPASNDVVQNLMISKKLI